MKATGRGFFVSLRRKPLNRRTAWLAIRKHGDLAGQELPTYAHRLKHAFGLALAGQGADTRLIQDNSSHRGIRHSVIYTAANPAMFERLWR
jgi:type 1 fimbriae regulatory protein FimB